MCIKIHGKGGYDKPESHQESVMGLTAEESDLSGAGPFRRDADSLAVMPFWMLRPLAWAFLLLAALLLAAHHIILTRKGGGPC